MLPQWHAPSIFIANFLLLLGYRRSCSLPRGLKRSRCPFSKRGARASRQQGLSKPLRRQVATQSFFARPIQDEARHRCELTAQLIITRFVRKQSLLGKFFSFDPLPEKVAGLDRARRQRRDFGVFDVLRTELAQKMILNPRLGPIDHHTIAHFACARVELEKSHGAQMLPRLDPSGL